MKRHVALVFAMSLGALACGGAGQQRDPSAKPDAAATRPTVANEPVPNAQPPAGTPMQMSLHSTPPGAMAFVDGVQIGATPISHTVYITGVPVAFAFELNGYQRAVYTFVPQTAGEVHGRLIPSALVAPENVLPTP